RRAGLNRGDARNLPPAEDLAIESVLPTQQLVTRTDRNIHNINADEAVTDVERRRAAFEPQVEPVVCYACFAQRAEESRVVVNSFAQRVADLEEFTFAPSVLTGEDHAVVMRVTLPRRKADRAVVLARKDVLVRRLGAELARIADDYLRLVRVNEDA